MYDGSSFLISVEGIEGCGKSTLLEGLKTSLHNLYPLYTFHYFREPGATLWGEQVRSILLNASLKRCPLSEVFLFLSARAQLNEEHIIPLLKTPKQVIILDRYYDSTLVYQGYTQGINQNFLKTLHQNSSLNVHPNKTFYLRISAKTSLERQRIRNQKKDYFEQWDHEKTQKLVEGFDALAKDESQRICIINAEEKPQDVLESTLAVLKELLTKQK